MAKILDKKLSSVQNKLLSLRQKLDFYQEELDYLDEKYQAKMDKVLSAFIKKADKKLEKYAFEACDKEAYAQAVIEEKLQKYDVKAYMKHREANHGAAKAIFAGGNVSEALAKNKEQIALINAKRKEYIDRLEAEKAEFLQKNSATSDKAYNELSKQLKAEFDAKENELKVKLDGKKAKEKASIEAKISKLQSKISELHGQLKSFDKLEDDVLLDIEGLKMYFGGLKAVDDLSFKVKKGEIFGLIGPNGAGKTTVFNCITQFYKPTAGKIRFAISENEVITLTDYKVHDIVLKGISRTFQNIEVVKEVTVLENLLIAATRYYNSNLFTQMFHLPALKREEQIMRAKADKILKYMDLYSYRDRLAWGLPYGVLKRIEIARALMCNPKLIILDEPAAGLNESETADLAALIHKIRTDMGCTILLVEHDMSLVMSICDHICAISFGKKLACGTPAEVQASKEVQEAYLGSGGE